MRSATKSKRSLRGAESSRDKSGRFRKGTHWRPHAIFRERPYLVEQYVEKKRSAKDIAVEHGVTENAILFWLTKLKIQRRTMVEVRSVKHWGLPGAANPMFGRCGSDNPRWIDGSSPERQRLYARSFWRELVLAVYKRDGFKCVRCGKSRAADRRLHAHHVRPWAGNPDARFDLANILTVCQPCHNWIHSRKNRARELLSR